MATAGTPTVVTIEAEVRRAPRPILDADGKFTGQMTPAHVEDLGIIAYWHRNPIKRILGQRHVRGSSIWRGLTGRAPRVEQHQEGPDA